MTTSSAQTSANRLNAQKSTGPISEVGKNMVAGNAIKHGIFSKKLILSAEDPFEYQSLLEQLKNDLKPQGTLEKILIEQIVVSLWRQKRLFASMFLISIYPSHDLGAASGGNPP